MRIAYFADSLPPQTDGVSHTYTRLVESLKSSENDFLFFSPFKPDKSIDWRDKVRKIVSVPFPLYSYYRVGLPMFEDIISELSNFQPDIIHVSSPTLLGIAGLRYAERMNIPGVSTYHTHFVHYFRYYGFKTIENLGWSYLRWFHNRCQMTYAPSPSARSELIAQGIKHVELWQRGIDLQNFSSRFRDNQLRKSIDAETKPILLFVGRLVKEKDLDDLVKASSILQDWGDPFKLVVIGDGPMRKELEERLPSAHFTGYLKGEPLSRWYASSDIFVFPSTTETFGNVVMEAFASGLPVIGVNKGGVADLISSGKNGLLSPANNPVDLAYNIKMLLNNTALRNYMSNQAQQYANQHSWDAINGKLMSSYTEILDNFYSLN